MQDICSDIRTAIDHGRTDILRTLLGACENENVAEGITKEEILNQPFFEEGTFLSYASKTNQVDVVRTLLSCGADPAVKDAHGRNAVDVAASEVIRFIYVEELLRATAASEVDRVVQLLEAGIEVNSWDSEGSKNTSLHWAACYGNKSVVACLIDRGADVNAENGCGATPLHEAVSRGDVTICQELLQAGANPHIRALQGTFAGKSPYDLARNKPAIFAMLQRSMPNPVAKESENLTSPVNLYADTTNFTQKSHSLDISQLSIDSTKSSDPLFSPNLREPAADSPRSSPHKVGAWNLIWPEPKIVMDLSSVSPPFLAGKEIYISIIQGSESIHDILDVWEVSRSHLLLLGHDVKVGEVQPGSGRFVSDNRIECIVNRRLFNVAEGYQVHVSQNSIKVSAGSLAGLHYAVCTLVQLLRLSKNVLSDVTEVESVLIKDEPRFMHRGILLDISPRGRTPTLEYLLHTIDLWSSFKISHLHLYSRLSPSCDWQLCYSRSEMVTLDRYCRDRHLDLIPALDVDANVSQRHLTQMWPVFQELLAIFPSLSYVHVGPRLASLLVQPDNLDSSLSVNETVETDMSEVFKSYSCLQELWHILNLSNATTLLLCSNGLHSKSEFRSVPSNVILVEYGFQADYDFSEWTDAFKTAGGNVLPSSGTASYNSLAGCPASTLANTRNALKMALEQNSIGIVVAHWSGSHHLTPHPFSWLGYLIAAGLSWNPTSEIELGPSENFEGSDVGSGCKHQRYLTNILDTHVFQDLEHKIGEAILELGRVDTLVLTLSKNQDSNDLQQIPDNRGSTLYRLLTDPDNVNLEFLSADLFAKMTKQIKRVTHSLYEASITAKFGSMELQELQLTADLMVTACRIGRTLIGLGVNPNSNMGLAVINLGVCNLPPTFRTDIANKMLAHIEQYKGAWLQRHLPLGLQSSLLVLTSALHRFVPES